MVDVECIIMLSTYFIIIFFPPFLQPEAFFEDASQYDENLTFQDMNLSRPLLKVRCHDSVLSSDVLPKVLKLTTLKIIRTQTCILVENIVKN